MILNVLQAGFPRIKKTAVLKFRQASIHNPYLIKIKLKVTKTREISETFNILRELSLAIFLNVYTVAALKSITMLLIIYNWCK